LYNGNDLQGQARSLVSNAAIVHDFVLVIHSECVLFRYLQFSNFCYVCI